MTATLLGSSTFTFADGSGGHVCTLPGGAPSAGQLDVLCVNSNTVVATPAGFTAALSVVNSQGAYVFTRVAAGGEGATVTVTTSGNHNTQVAWSRWGNITGADTTKSANTDGVDGTTTPAVTTNPLAGGGELVIAFGALHGLAASTPASPVWSTGYTPLTAATQGTLNSGVTGFVAYNAAAGPGAESPNVSWTNLVSDRYMLVAAFTASGGGGFDPRVASAFLAFF